MNSIIPIMIFIFTFAQLNAQLSIFGGGTINTQSWLKSESWSNINIPEFEIDILNIKNENEDELIKKFFSAQIGINLKADLEYVELGVEAGTGKYSNAPYVNAYAFAKYKWIAAGFKSEIDTGYKSLKPVKYVGIRNEIKIGEKPNKGNNDLRKAALQLHLWFPLHANLRLIYKL